MQDVWPSDIPVLIVGGSLNGLSAALLLARRSVPCLLVERHPDTSIQYKFRGISPRTMEIYRAAGIEDEIRARDLIDDRAASIARVKNLSAPDISWQGVPWSDTSDLGSTPAATCDQDQLEPILRAHAERLGASTRFNAELVSIEQDDERVIARIRCRATGALHTVRASYLIAADGTESSIRDRLRIGRHGPGVLQHWMNVIFETDLSATLEGRQIRAVFVLDINGTFVPRGDGRWLMAVQYAPERGERPEDFTASHCEDLIRRGAGRSDVKVSIIDARQWDAAANVADRFVAGRVLIVGDAAHVMPPTGGFGGNTGIQDVHNLAWKLDAVLRGVAVPGLLQTYDQERRPTADATMAQALARLQAWFKDPSRRLPPAEPIVDDNHVIFGYRYRAGAFIDDESGDIRDVFENPREPSGRPGSRAPQMMVEHNGTRVSTIDLFANQWVLFAGPRGDVWRNAIRTVPTARAFEVMDYQTGRNGNLHDVHERWSKLFGADADGAVLIRPDGMIAWRARTAGHPGAGFGDIFEHLSFKSPASMNR